MTGHRPEDGREQDLSAPDRGALRAAFVAVDALPRGKDQLLPALHAAQDAIGWLPREAIEHVHEHTRVPLSELYATVTAYSELRVTAPAPGRWRVCTGLSCKFAGADELVAASPERTARVDCQFLCALAPVVVDDAERPYGRMTPEALRERLDAIPAPARGIRGAVS